MPSSYDSMHSQKSSQTLSLSKLYLTYIKVSRANAPQNAMNTATTVALEWLQDITSQSIKTSPDYSNTAWERPSNDIPHFAMALQKDWNLNSYA